MYGGNLLYLALWGVSKSTSTGENAGEGPSRPSFLSSGVLLSSQFYLLQLGTTSFIQSTDNWPHSSPAPVCR